MGKDTMKKTAAIAKTARHPGTAPGAIASRLPVAPAKAKTAPATYGAKAAPPPLWTNFGKALEDLPEMAREVVRINREIAALKEEADAYRSAVRGLMELVDDKKSWSCRDLDENWIVTYVKGKPGKKLVPELLIKAGVSVKQLEKGYKETPAKKDHVQVKVLGEKSTGNEEEE